MRRFLLAGVAAATIGGTAFAGAASAAPIITGSASPPITTSLIDLGTSTSQGYQNSNTITAGDQTITFVAGTGPQSGVYAGSTTSVAASPFGSESGPNYENYLVAEPTGGSVTITFANPQDAFALLWGTVDANPVDYNELTFTFGGGGASQTVDGADIASALGISGGGTVNANVLISNLAPFTTVTATASQIAFEFVPGTPVPEPGSLALLGTALIGLGVVGWGHRKRRPA